MGKYPWRNTSEDIAEQAQSQWETPSGSQKKADAAEQAAKDYSDNNLNAHIGTGGDAHALAVPNVSAGFISGADQSKLESVSPGAEVNQNAFSSVIVDGQSAVVANNKSADLTIEGGVGISVSTNANSRKVRLTATGTAIPANHGSEHVNPGGSDPIPFATVDTGGLMSPDDKQILLETPVQIESISDRISETNTAIKNAKEPLIIVTYDGTDMITHPDVYKVYENFGTSGSDVPATYMGYTYWMAATPYPQGNQFYENPSLYVSNDGVNWIVPPGVTNPIIQAPDPRGRVVPYQNDPGLGDFLSDPNLFVDQTDSKLKMIYRLQNNDVGMLDTILYVESGDGGKTWTAPSTILTANYSVLSPSIIQLGPNSYEMYYVKGANNIFSLCKRTSTNLLTWSTEIPLNMPSFSEGRRPWHVDALKSGQDIELLINCNPAAVHSPDSLFLLTSTNGIDFSFINDGSPILENSRIGWDNNYIYRSSFSKTNDDYYQIWYSGSNLKGEYRIAYLEGYIDTLSGLSSKSVGVPFGQIVTFNKGSLTQSFEGTAVSRADGLTLNGIKNPTTNKKVVKVNDNLIVGNRVSVTVQNQAGQNSPMLELKNEGVSTVGLIPDPSGTNRLKLCAISDINFGAMLTCKNIIVSNDGGGGTYNEGYVKIGDMTLFSDPTTNRLKQKYGYPTSNEDGEIVPGFVGIPASKTASGKKGQIAADINFLYVCYADNNWIRVAKDATW